MAVSIGELYRCHGFFTMTEMQDGLILIQGSYPLDIELAEILGNGVLMKLGRNQKVVDLVDKTSAPDRAWLMFHMKLVDKTDGS